MPEPYPPHRHQQTYRVTIRIYPKHRARRLFFAADSEDAARRQAEAYCAWIYPGRDFRILRVRAR